MTRSDTYQICWKSTFATSKRSVTYFSVKHSETNFENVVMNHMDLKYGHDHVQYFSLNCCGWFGTKVCSDCRVTKLILTTFQQWACYTHGWGARYSLLWFTETYVTLLCSPSAMFHGRFISRDLRLTSSVSYHICNSSVETVIVLQYLYKCTCTWLGSLYVVNFPWIHQ